MFYHFFWKGIFLIFLIHRGFEVTVRVSIKILHHAAHSQGKFIVIALQPQIKKSKPLSLKIVNICNYLQHSNSKRLFNFSFYRREVNIYPYSGTPQHTENKESFYRLEELNPLKIQKELLVSNIETLAESIGVEPNPVSQAHYLAGRCHAL